MLRNLLLASDFDQALSFNDSGVMLSELIGFHSFHDKVKGLAEINLVQQGAELSYLILHDPDFRRVRREHLVETGRRIRRKDDVALSIWSSGQALDLARCSHIQLWRYLRGSVASKAKYFPVSRCEISVSRRDLRSSRPVSSPGVQTCDRKQMSV